MALCLQIVCRFRILKMLRRTFLKFSPLRLFIETTVAALVLVVIYASLESLLRTIKINRLVSKHPKLIFGVAPRPPLVPVVVQRPTNYNDTMFRSPRISKEPMLHKQTFEQRRRFVASLKASVEQNYIKKMRLWLLSNTTVKFLTYECSERVGMCGGFGDRTRGLVSAFYLAICTGRVFNIIWSKSGSHLQDYFEINAALYQVPAATYLKQAASSLLNPQRIISAASINAEFENRFTSWTATSDLATELQTCNHVVIVTNSMAALEGTLKNVHCKPAYDHLLAAVDPLNSSLDMSVFVSAALQTIFDRPTPRLSNKLADCIIGPAGGADAWQHATRIGVQVRRLQPIWSEGGERVSDSHLPCFAQVLREIAAKKKQRLIVYVTASDDLSFDVVKASLAPFSDTMLTVVSSDSCRDLPSTHVDRSRVSLGGDIWTAFAKTYLDWLALTKMDRLIISRSGFAESASFYSLQPTHRLAHWLSHDKDVCIFHEFNVIGARIKMEE